MWLMGYISLGFFLVTIILTLMRKINLPVQTVLVLASLGCLLIGVPFKLAQDGIQGVLALPNQMLGGIIVHPITALLAGLLLAGALSASGGFLAFRAILNWLQKTPIGLAGTLVILMQIPLIASLPCGRIIAAALLPLLFAFGSEGGMNLLTKSQMIVLIGAFARNAFGSCGPSPIGGVGQIGEGFLGSYYPLAANGILRAPQALGLMVGTALTALFLKWISQKLYPNDVTLKDKDESKTSQAKEQPKPKFRGYASLFIFVAALIVAIFQPFGKIPVQTTLVVAAILIMVVGKVGLEDLMAGIILLPVTAMISGFLAAGALAATDAFAALGNILKGIANIPVLGIAGMLAIFVQAQTILPLSCARIITAALVPVLYLFGPAYYNFLSWPELAIVMSAYMINATTSCGPSPLGGGGMMGEGQMRAETGYIRGAYTFASMATMAPLAAVSMKYLNLSIFDPQNPEMASNLASLAFWGLIIVLANLGLVRLLRAWAERGIDVGWKFGMLGYALGGAMTGGVIAFAVYGLKLISIGQGLFGGVLAGALIGSMVPKRLVPEPKEI